MMDVLLSCKNKIYDTMEDVSEQKREGIEAVSDGLDDEVHAWNMFRMGSFFISLVWFYILKCDEKNVLQDTQEEVSSGAIVLKIYNGMSSLFLHKLSRNYTNPWELCFWEYINIQYATSVGCRLQSCMGPLLRCKNDLIKKVYMSNPSIESSSRFVFTFSKNGWF